MINILFVCVNYNTYNKLNSFLFSVNKAAKTHRNSINVTLLIGDNSIPNYERLVSSYNNIEIVYINNNGNKGYIGGVREAVLKSNIVLFNYDILIISNVDLTVSDSFFQDILNVELNSNIGWVAPAIISQKENRDRNPKINNRPSKKNLILLKMMYKYPILHNFYEKTVYKLKQKKLSSSSSNRIIYAGHGSFMIFNKTAFLKKDFLEFPSFLFGEEIYFAEIMRNNNLEVIYCPEIIINDFDHASTGKLKRKDYYKMNVNSLGIIIKKYFINE